MYVCVGVMPSATPRGVGTAILAEEKWMKLKPEIFFVGIISTRAQRCRKRRKESPKRFLATTVQLYHHRNVIKREPVLVIISVPTITASFIVDVAKDPGQNRLGKIETLASIATSGLGQARATRSLLERVD